MPYVQLARMSRTGSQDMIERDEARLVASVAARWPRSPSYFHSFGMSENYYILAEQPLSSNVLAMLCRKFTGASFLDNLKFHDKEQVHVHTYITN